MHLSCDFGILSFTNHNLLEDKLCVSRKDGIGESECGCRTHGSWLPTEWSAMERENTSVYLYGLNFWYFRQFSFRTESPEYWKLVNEWWESQMCQAWMKGPLDHCWESTSLKYSISVEWQWWHWVQYLKPHTYVYAYNICEEIDLLPRSAW